MVLVFLNFTSQNSIILAKSSADWYPKTKILARSGLTALNTTYTMGHTIFLTLYSIGKLDEKWMKMDKNLSIWMKIVEMNENVIYKCMNPQYWWTHSICCMQCSKSLQKSNWDLKFEQWALKECCWHANYLRQSREY
jgi:hypothetical protein